MLYSFRSLLDSLSANFYVSNRDYGAFDNLLLDHLIFLAKFEKYGFKFFEEMDLETKLMFFNSLVLPSNDCYKKAIENLPGLDFSNLLPGTWIDAAEVSTRRNNLVNKYTSEMIDHLRKEIKSHMRVDEQAITLFMYNNHSVIGHSMYFCVHLLYPNLEGLTCENMDILRSYEDHFFDRLLFGLMTGAHNRTAIRNKEEAQKLVDLVLDPIRALKSLTLLNWSRNRVFETINHFRVPSIDTLFNHESLQEIKLHCAGVGPLRKLLTDSPVRTRRLILTGSINFEGVQEHLRRRPFGYQVGCEELLNRKSFFAPEKGLIRLALQRLYSFLKT